jgi:hypothetical protein
MFTSLLHRNGSSSIVVCVFISAGTCLPICYIAMNYSGFQASCHNIKHWGGGNRCKYLAGIIRLQSSSCDTMLYGDQHARGSCCLHLLPSTLLWRRRQLVPVKCHYHSIELHGITSQETIISVFTAVRKEYDLLSYNVMYWINNFRSRITS